MTECRRNDYEERRRQRLLAKFRRAKRKTAEEKGGQNEARALLGSAVAAISSLLEGGQIGEGDAVALEFLRDGLREHLNNSVPIDRALCVDKEHGAPKIPDLLPLLVYVPYIDREYQSRNNVSKSLASAAGHFGVSVTTVRRAWNAAGGIQGHLGRKIK